MGRAYGRGKVDVINVKDAKVKAELRSNTQILYGISFMLVAGES